MAATKVEITFKPDKGSVPLPELLQHLALVESVADVTVTDGDDIDMTLETDYDDDKHVLVATWTV
jgi:hypothetical protein